MKNSEDHRLIGQPTTANSRRFALLLVVLCACLSILPPFFNPAASWVDFRAIYAGTRCLLSHHDPYQVSELQREYRSEDGIFPPDNARFNQAVTLYVNLPTTFVLVAPLGWMPWASAHLLWMLLSSVAFLLGLLLMWELGSAYSLEISTLLACVLAVNCQGTFITGNTAGLVVGLCVIAVWCFLRNRFVWAGVFCLGLSLAIKPHDSGLIWLYFLLAAGSQRKRAWQSLAVTAAVSLVAVLWISHVAPHWLLDWRANLAAIAAPGGINDPGPNSIMGHYASLVVDLQAAISIFYDHPHLYNLASYLVCGCLLCVWGLRTLRSLFTPERALLALSAVAAFTMLVTYHRPWDAKLVMLAIPACSMFWPQRGRIGNAALAITGLAILLTGDFTLGILTIIFSSLHLGMTTLLAKILAVLILRPASLALLAVGVFYLWMYLRDSGLPSEGAEQLATACKHG